MLLYFLKNEHDKKYLKGNERRSLERSIIKALKDICVGLQSFSALYEVDYKLRYVRNLYGDTID